MTFVPQELVDAIVSEIDDVPSLKACALTGSVFRDPSQRILLRSLSLNQDFRGSSTLLDESPHVNAYIICLTIRLDWNPSVTDIERFQEILVKLAIVRQCIMSGMGEEFRVGYHTPTFPSALLCFLRRQPLQELNVLHWYNVPPAVILRFLATAPMVSFFNVYVNEDTEVPTPDAQQSSAKPLEELIFEINANSVRMLFTQPRFKSHTKALRRLSLVARFDPSNSLIFDTADTLQHIRLDLGGFTAGVLPLPPLPLLRSAEFLLLFYVNPTPWFSDLILATLSASPLLTNIVISFFPLRNDRSGVPGALLDATLLATLDAALVAHPARPTIRWRLDFMPDFHEPTGAESLFVAGVQSGMPKAHKEKRLTFERCEDDVDELAYRKRFSEFIVEVQGWMPSVSTEGHLGFERYELQRTLDG
ncbi:hypothetical protein MVEN_01473700 [Mycena venus]|uniref:Uncharacterized protein n=1 Tax=Mycena venus TaxID=2733690 RepID=A0A8H6XUX3_9AGAR|nr:hypothetical protein MVEN_01473700 [Mycena venus]